MMMIEWIIYIFNILSKNLFMFYKKNIFFYYINKIS